MSLTASTMMPLGSKAPDFSLTDTATGKLVSLSEFAGAPALMVIFLCNHCPFVKHLQHQMAALVREYQAKEVAVVGISSNDVTSHPQDGPELMAIEKAVVGYTFPYLYDPSQVVARSYQAACTPDFFLFDRDASLVYRGQFDASRPGNGMPVTGADLRAALDAVLAGKPVSQDQKPSIGCNIKWTPGNEPA